MDNVVIGETYIFHKNFIKALIKPLQDSPYKQIRIHIVSLKGEKKYQFSYFTSKKDISKNYSVEAALHKFDSLLAEGFSSMYIKTTTKDVQITNKNGKYLVRNHKPQQSVLETNHDREKNKVLSPKTSYAFLQAIGIQTNDGKIISSKWKKFHQINEFLAIISKTIKIDSFSNDVTVVDIGCGNAYLTFATYYYFSRILGKNIRLVGVDSNEELIKRNNKRAKSLQWDEMEFVSAKASDYTDLEPDIVLALHACDTATDDALCYALKSKTKYIFAVPCCHKHIQQQMRIKNIPIDFKPILREGIYKERFGDMLTDTVRALYLRMNGYKTDIFQFVSSMDTAKNIMIRAVRKGDIGDEKAKEEYEHLKKVWNISPFLESICKIVKNS